MDYRASQRRPRRDETLEFRRAIRAMRKEAGWSQERMGLHLGISKRTVSHWECGYWLPPFKQRVHLVAALDPFPSVFVLAIANGLGVSGNPVLAPMLKRHIDAIEKDDEGEAGGEGSAGPVAEGAATDAVQPVLGAPPDAPLEVASAPTNVEPLRAAIDAVVREAADEMNVAANDVRAALGRALAECARVNASLEDARAAVAVRRGPARREGGG